MTMVPRTDLDGRGEREIPSGELLLNQSGGGPPGVMEDDDLVNGDDACHMSSWC